MKIKNLVLQAIMLASATVAASCQSPQKSEVPTDPVPAAESVPSSQKLPCWNWENMGLKLDSYNSFMAEFKKAVENNDADAISKLILYPPRASVGDQKNLKIKNAADFKMNFTKIFSPKFREKLLRSFDEDVICRHGQFIGMGRGEIWIAEAEATRGLKIVTINADDK